MSDQSKALRVLADIFDEYGRLFVSETGDQLRRGADHIDALTAMVERLADECEGWVGYVTESVHCEAYKQAMIPVNEARALIGEKADAP